MKQGDSQAENRLVRADMTIDATIKRYPELVPVFFRLAMNCPHCHISRFHDIEAASEKYGIDLSLLLDELNKTVKNAHHKAEG